METASLLAPLELLAVALEHTPAQIHTSTEESGAVIHCLLTK